MALLLGPEGGWTDRERALIGAPGWSPVSLGPLILRAETAAIAGLAIINAAWEFDIAMTKAGPFHFMAGQKLGVLGTIFPHRGRSAIGLGWHRRHGGFGNRFRYGRELPQICIPAANPAASFVFGWAGEVTVQFEGRAFQPIGEELTRYQQIYFAAYPECPDRLSWPGIAYFVVRPRWIRYSDYDQRPPLIEEFTF